MEVCLEALLELCFCTKPPNFRVEAHIEASTGVALRKQKTNDKGILQFQELTQTITLETLLSINSNFEEHRNKNDMKESFKNFSMN
jgi:hypothetical protein